MTDNSQPPTLEQQIEQLQNELNDAYLVIGQQQVTLLRLQMVLREKEKEQKPDVGASSEREPIPS
jgi:hypothetical protein